MKTDTTDVDDVIELLEYYDGPRVGIATYAGKRYRFQSQMKDVYGAEGVEDDFLLTPLDDAADGAMQMRAEFEVAPDSPRAGPGVWPKFKVRWRQIDGASSNAKRDSAP